MRAPFDTTCDFVDGPASLTPGVVRFSGTCRLVPETRELALETPFSERVAYVTQDSGLPFGPMITYLGEVYTVDYAHSDRIAVPSGQVPVYEVLFTELVIPYNMSSYYRSHVRFIPGLSILLQEDSLPLLQEDGSLLLLP